jgi:hypothetical protein
MELQGYPRGFTYHRRAVTAGQAQRGFPSFGRARDRG